MSQKACSPGSPTQQPWVPHPAALGSPPSTYTQPFSEGPVHYWQLCSSPGETRGVLAVGERSREKIKTTWGGVASTGAGSPELVFWATMKITVSSW